MSTKRTFQLPTKETYVSSASKHDISDENGNLHRITSEYSKSYVYSSLRSTLSKEGSNNCKLMNTPRNPCSLKKCEYTSKRESTSPVITETNRELVCVHDGSVDSNGNIRMSPGKNSNAALKRPHGGHHNDNRKRLKSVSTISDDDVDGSSDSSRSLQGDNGKKNIFESMPESNNINDCPKRLIVDANDDETLRSSSHPKKITDKAVEHATSLRSLLSQMPTLTVQITRLESMFSMNVKSSGPKTPLPAHSPSPGKRRVSTKDQNSSEAATKDGVSQLVSVSHEAPSSAVATLSLPPRGSKVTTSPGLSGVPPSITETISKFAQVRDCKSSITGYTVTSPRCHMSTPFNSRETTPKSTMLQDINIKITEPGSISPSILKSASQKTPAITKTTKSAIPKYSNRDSVECMSVLPKEPNISEIAIKPLLLTVDKISVADIDSSSSSSSVSADRRLAPSTESNRPETTPNLPCSRDGSRNIAELLLLKESSISETFQSFAGDKINATELTLSPDRNSTTTRKSSTPKDGNKTVAKDVSSIHLTRLESMLPQKIRKLCNFSPGRPKCSPLKDYDCHLNELRTSPEKNGEAILPGSRDTELTTSPSGYCGVTEVNLLLPGSKVTDNKTSSPTGNNNVRRHWSPANGKVTRSNSSSPMKRNDTRSITSSPDKSNVTKSTSLSPVESKITIKSSLPKAGSRTLSDPTSPTSESHMIRSPPPDDSIIIRSASSSSIANTATTQGSSLSKDDDCPDAGPNTPTPVNRAVKRRRSLSVTCNNNLLLQSLSPVNRITRQKTLSNVSVTEVKPKKSKHGNPTISICTNRNRKEIRPKSSTSANSQITGLKRHDANHNVARLKSSQNKLTRNGKIKNNRRNTTTTKDGKNKNKLKTTTTKDGNIINNKLMTTTTKGGNIKNNKLKTTTTKDGNIINNKLKTTTTKGGKIKNSAHNTTTTKDGNIINNRHPSFLPELGNIKVPKENNTTGASNQTMKTYKFFASKNQVEGSNGVEAAVSASHGSLDTKSNDVATSNALAVYDMDVNIISKTLPITDNKQDFPVIKIKSEPDVKVLVPKPVRSKKAKTKRLKSSGNRCPVCVRYFPFLSQLKIHLLTHSGLRPYQCDFCSKSFIRVSDLRTHLRIHTKEKPYVCDVCSRAFAQSSHLHQHEKVHSGEKPYKCDACGKTFKIKSHLNAHITCSHNSEKAHTCEKCGKSYKLKSHLVHHSRSHLPFSLHKCSVCEKSFKTVSSLKRHQKCHSDIKPFKCQDCGQTFREKHNMLRHQKISQGDFAMPFSCKYCRKLFRQKDHLVVHLRVHTDERPYECEACGKLFKQIGALRIHHKLHVRWEDL